MKVYIIAYGSTPWQNGRLIFDEANRQKLDVSLGLVEWPFNHLIRDIERTKPTWIFLTGSRTFPPDKLVKLAKIAKLALWDADAINEDRIKIWNELKGIPSIIFTVISNLDSSLASQVLWTPQYYDDEFYKPTVSLSCAELYDVVFLGSLDEKRKHWIEKLQEKYHVFHAENVFGSEMANVYRQSKIAFGIWREGFEAGAFATSDRIFKAMGSGCCYLHHTVKNPELLFTPEKHFDTYFDTYETLDEMIEYYLGNSKQREFIRIAGRAEILEKHTLKVRLPQYWKVMEKYK